MRYKKGYSDGRSQISSGSTPAISPTWVLKASASLRAIGEHPFRLLKRQFHFRKVRYRGLSKNTAGITTKFALANLYQVRGELLPVAG